MQFLVRFVILVVGWGVEFLIDVDYYFVEILVEKEEIYNFCYCVYLREGVVKFFVD